VSTLEIGPKDKGRHIELRKGDILVVRLPENPSTGYRWAVHHDGGVLQVEGTHFDPMEGSRVGAGGWRTLRLKAAATGTAKLQLKLWQEWEGDASVSDRYDVSVRVD
jgi:inhibitor of cysteine peptidase